MKNKILDIFFNEYYYMYGNMGMRSVKVRHNNSYNNHIPKLSTDKGHIRFIYE